MISDRSFARFRDQWAVRLTTYKRDGTPVSSPVNIAVERDHAYFRTFEENWKFKRLQHNSSVEVAPSTFTGKRTGPSSHALARLLTGSEDRHASELIDAKHRLFQGVLVRLMHRLRGLHARHFELTIVPR